MAIVNPPIPYVGGIPGGCHGGRSVTIIGKVPHHHHQHQHGFSVNLSCGPQVEPFGDTGLHFNPRFNEGCIARNHFHHGSWGTEEKRGGLPINKGQPFEIIIFVEHGHYEVSLNGKHFCNFNHRIPRERIQYLIICGGVEIICINFGGPGSQPSMPAMAPGPARRPAMAPATAPTPAGSQPGYSAGGFMMPPSYPAGGGAGAACGALFPGQPVYSPAVPLTSQITGGIFPGRMINISGVPRGNFSINVQCGSYDGVDVAFHFNPRLNENCVVRNTLTNGTWGAEDRGTPYFPFQHNVSFDLLILIEQGAFKVAVNNQHFVEYYHRLQPISRADTLKIAGEIQINQVKIQ